MSDLSMKNLKSKDVDELFGLTLCVAYAIYVEGWQWFEFPGSDTPYLLLDAPLPASVRVPDKDCALYIGDDYYVFKDLVRYHESLKSVLNAGVCIANAGYSWEYGHYMEKELQSSNHVRLLHAPPEKRCRAILKFYLDHPNLREELMEKK